MQKSLSLLTMGTAAMYQIIVNGYLDSDWSYRFSDMDVKQQVAEDGSAVTVLTGELIDQAALLGVIDGLYGLGFPLLSVSCLEARQG